MGFKSGWDSVAKAPSLKDGPDLFKPYLTKEKEKTSGSFFDKVGSAMGAKFASAVSQLSNTIGLQGFGFGSGLTSSTPMYVRDSRHSRYSFGLNTPYYVQNTPRFKFNYFVRIKYNLLATAATGAPFVELFLNRAEREMLVPLTKTVKMPSMKIETEKINQYNKTSLVHKKITYEDITLEMHDTVDGKTLRFWEMYQEYYFKDSLVVPEISEALQSSVTEAAAKINSAKNALSSLKSKRNIKKQQDIINTSLASIPPYTRKLDSAGEYSYTNYDRDELSYGDFGYNLEAVKNNKHLINAIEIYQVHGGRWSKVVLVNPKIVSFEHDTLDYAESKTTSVKFGIAYEYALYHNYATMFSKGDGTGAEHVYKYSGHLELKQHTLDPGFQLRQRELGKNPIDPASTESKQKRTGVLGNLQEGIAGLLENGGDQLGDAVSQGILTGKFKSPFDSKAISKSLIGGVKNQVKTGASQAAKTATSGALSVGNVAADSLRRK